MTELPPDEIPPSRADRRTFWLSIIASFIASILFALFFQPFVSAINNIIVNIIGIFYKGYIDYLYDQAAQSPADLSLYFIFQLIAILPPVMSVMTFVVLRIDRMKSSKANLTRAKFITFILLPISFIIFMIMIAGPAVSITANAKFQRRLMALSPVISEQDRKELLGKWAMMKSRSDYEKIYNEIQNLAQKYHTELPDIR